MPASARLFDKGVFTIGYCEGCAGKLVEDPRGTSESKHLLARFPDLPLETHHNENFFPASSPPFPTTALSSEAEQNIGPLSANQLPQIRHHALLQRQTL